METINSMIAKDIDYEMRNYVYDEFASCKEIFTEAVIALKEAGLKPISEPKRVFDKRYQYMFELENGTLIKYRQGYMGDYYVQDRLQGSYITITVQDMRGDSVPLDELVKRIVEASKQIEEYNLTIIDNPENWDLFQKVKNQTEFISYDF